MIVRKYIYALAMIVICPFGQSLAQLGAGVTEGDFSTIQTLVNSIFGPGKYEIFDIVNVDSTKDPGAPDGVEDPYGTLKQCYVFIARGKGMLLETRPKGFIGIFKNGQIIWKSDTLINNDEVVNAEIVAIGDLNRDGKVDIVTKWQEGMRGDIAYLWIFSWDGHIGSVINDINAEHRSTIVSVLDDLHIVDLNGDGIKEIVGKWSDVPMEEYPTVTYSWNGQLYGKWPNPPQPPPGGSLPKNKADVAVKATVTRDTDGSLLFSYVVENKPTSLQKLESFLVMRRTDSISVQLNRSAWESLVRRKVPSILWVDLSETNLISQGEKESSFGIRTPALPVITSYYAQGWNGRGNLAEIFTNSVQGKTLGPADPPNPFVPVAFIDTIASYKHRAFALGWIKNRGIVQSLDAKLENAKRQLQRNNTTAAKNILQAFLNEVEALWKKENQRRNPQGVQITSEAYALLKFNAEYLIAQLQR